MAEARHMTDEDIKKIVAETVTETLIKLGMDAADPLEVQADMQHLRSWRQAVATVKRQGLVTAVGILVAGVIGLIWVAVKSPAG